MIRLIAAISLNEVLGERGNNKLLWKSDIDMAFFKSNTVGSAIVMGRNTFESLGSRPLPDRQNIVLSNTLSNIPGVLVYNDYKDILKDFRDFYVIGGLSLYNLFLPLADEVILTTISVDIPETENIIKFPVAALEAQFHVTKESIALQDTNKITNRPINLVFSRWSRNKGVLN